MTEQAARAMQVLDAANGRHEGYRALHAKGTLCRGTFKASAAAKELTRALHMQGDAVPVTVRFSNGGGNPRVSDRGQDGRGIAVKHYLPDGSTTDKIGLNLPCFFVRTPEDFIAFTRAAKPVIAGKPGPRFLLYLARHPEALRAVSAALRWKPPASYATVRYNSLHAYKWVAADGSERFVRYTWVPAAGEHNGAGETRDYLQEEVAERLAREPIRFTLQVQIAADGDRTHDSTAPWPDDRERVDVGTLEVTRLETERERDGDVLVFDPTRVTDGIELSDDPLPALRSQAYSISVERRSGAKRPQQLR